MIMKMLKNTAKFVIIMEENSKWGDTDFYINLNFFLNNVLQLFNRFGMFIASHPCKIR